MYLPLRIRRLLISRQSTTFGYISSSIDLIITDPSFFDNVHYSELADFFYAWQRLFPRGFIRNQRSTTRHENEVQDTDAEQFALKLQQVFVECRRVLKKDGLLVFTYHHSRPDGWLALAQAVYSANFAIVQAHPVRSELSLATPKSQAKEPILIDAVIVCRKQSGRQTERPTGNEAVEKAVSVATRQIKRLLATGYQPTTADKFVIGAAQFFVALGHDITPSFALHTFAAQQDNLRDLLVAPNIQVSDTKPNYSTKSDKQYKQLSLAM